MVFQQCLLLLKPCIKFDKLCLKYDVHKKYTYNIMLYVIKGNLLRKKCYDLHPMVFQCCIDNQTMSIVLQHVMHANMSMFLTCCLFPPCSIVMRFLELLPPPLGRPERLDGKFRILALNSLFSYLSGLVHPKLPSLIFQSLPTPLGLCCTSLAGKHRPWVRLGRLLRGSHRTLP